MILKTGDSIHDLYMIRSGAVEIYRRKGELYNRIDAGDLFGQMGLLMNNKVRMPARAIEDTLVYCIPESIFNQLCDEFDSFADFVEVEDSARLRNVVSTHAEENDLTTSKVRTLLSRDPITISKDAPIQDAAMLMAEENISALLIVNPELDGEDEDSEPLVGIITDRDLCSRVLAQGLDTSLPVSEVMSADLISLDHNAYVFEAMLTMLRYNVHHLPVLQNKQPIDDWPDRYCPL
ncbi:predicted signal-transduction protein containing cAMP-binding and CBS domains [Photobacterium aphoticum]|uniref:Predicted signal-transduction protein containing cAMP-binding and CBS domains n=1 Tax=Photobacterium aphoticum TaxID=754436 RepID=A0A090QLT9_9GAMM|nr:predicted signal-transduction protein containing cAMP-binding and CBS domains [Photobacterium aphoticum]